MSDDRPDGSRASEGRERPETRSSSDRPDDPLFVPRLALDIASLERTTAEGTVGDDYPDILETICGAADDSQPVERYNGSLGVPVAFVAAHQSAVCQVQWNDNLASIYTNPGDVSGVRWGTGTMIADDLMLTCGHLFDQTGGDWQRPRQNGTSNIISPQDIARNMHVNFNYQVDPSGNLRPEQRFPIIELIEYRLGSIDMAICRIGGNPGATFGRAAISTTDAAVPDMLCIIGHPAGRPKRIEAGPTTQISGNLIRYNDIDTLGGNSGSGILRASDGRLVGIHTNGGCTPQSPAGGGSNFGQRIVAVIGVSPTLQRLTRPKIKATDDAGAGFKKLADDPVTLKFRDDTPRKNPAVDFPPKIKALDDVKFPVFDTRIPRHLGPAAPPPGGRPFVLSTPHHFGQEASGGGGIAEQYEAALAQLEGLLAAGEAQLASLDAQYRQLLAEYQAVTGQAEPGQDG